MSGRGGTSGPTQVPGWVLRANAVIDRLLLVVKVNLLWLLLSLAGLIVLGVAPASVAVAEVLIADRHGAGVRVLPRMWASFRAQFLRANVRLLPLLIVQAGSASMLWIVLTGGAPGTAMTIVLSGLAVMSLGWSLLSSAMIVAVPRLLRQDLLIAWRLALLLPGALPGRSVLLVLALTAWTPLCAMLRPLAPLFGAAVAIDLATALLSCRVAGLLEEIDGAGSTDG